VAFNGTIADVGNFDEVLTAVFFHIHDLDPFGARV
jgi:hypothetical protein